MAGPDEALRCPVCRATFRGSAVCSRCGTDLSMLMRTAARAYVQRQRAREALAAGDLAGALRHSALAKRLHRAGREGG